MAAKSHQMHGRDHAAGGCDPIPNSSVAEWAEYTVTSVGLSAGVNLLAIDWDSVDTSDSSLFSINGSGNIQIARPGSYSFVCWSSSADADLTYHAPVVSEWTIGTYTQWVEVYQDRGSSIPKEQDWGFLHGLYVATSATSAPYALEISIRSSAADAVTTGAGLKIVFLGGDAPF